MSNKSSFSRLHKWGITKCPGGRERNLRRSSLRGKVRTRTPSWLKIIREICVIYGLAIRGYISLRNQRNLRLIFFVPLLYFLLSAIVALRATYLRAYKAPLHLSRVLYKSTLFMQNKPNLLNAQMNVSSAITMNYEQKTMNYANKNKPNTNPIRTQSKPIYWMLK